MDVGLPPAAGALQPHPGLLTAGVHQDRGPAAAAVAQRAGAGGKGRQPDRQLLRVQEEAGPDAVEDLAAAAEASRVLAVARGAGHGVVRGHVRVEGFLQELGAPAPRPGRQGVARLAAEETPEGNRVRRAQLPVTADAHLEAAQEGRRGEGRGGQAWAPVRALGRPGL